MRELLLELSVLVRIRHPNIVTFWGTAADFPVAQGGDLSMFPAVFTAARAAAYDNAVATMFADSYWRHGHGLGGVQASLTLAWSSSCASGAAFTRRCIKITANVCPSKRRCGTLLATMHAQCLHTLMFRREGAPGSSKHTADITRHRRLNGFLQQEICQRNARRGV